MDFFLCFFFLFLKFAVQITAIDPDREAFEIGFRIMQKAGIARKINFIESEAQPVLDKLLEDVSHWDNI